MISLGYFNDTSQSLILFAGTSQRHLTEIIKPNDPRENCPNMKEAKYAEIRDLVKRASFRAVLRTELSDGTSLIAARCVLAIKSDEGEEERYKARYVARGHLDIMTDYLAHGAQTIQCVPVRIILDVAKIKDFRIWVVDFKPAYFPSDKPLIRKIFITNPVPELELSPVECLEFLKPIYGLAD